VSGKRLARRQRTGIGELFVKRYDFRIARQLAYSLLHFFPVSGVGSRPISFMKSCRKPGSLKVFSIASRRL